jgi:3-oxoacyl-[acyl-carrier-protein] synthase III
MIRLAGTAFALPASVVEVRHVLDAERARAEAARHAVSPGLSRRIQAGLGIDTVRACGPDEDPYGLAASAARCALGRAAVDPGQVDLIVDYSTLPGPGSSHRPLAHRLAADLGLETSLNLNMKFSGCAAFHLAVKLAVSLMEADSRLRVALLVAGDRAPEGSRSLLPITVQGDAGSAAVLVRDATRGPSLVATEVMTVNSLHALIEHAGDARGGETLVVDAARVEEEVLPIYYLHFHRLATRVLASAGLSLASLSRVVYSNVSQSDRDGFARSLGLSQETVCTPGLRALGHTFASDLVVNYTMLEESGAIRPGDWLLFAAAGIGFTWGVTLARA